MAARKKDLRKIDGEGSLVLGGKIEQKVMAEIDKTSPVLVTGATGYVAGWIVKNLLDKGITVHAAIRDVGNKSKRLHLDKIANKLNGNIKYFEADLLSHGSYKEAMDRCELVFHTASPFFLDSKDAQKELIEPALDGTRNVLDSANKTPSVKRVVLTSSVAAIYGDTIDSKNVPEGIFDESMWNTSSSPTMSEYSYSKTIAEKEAWKICGEQNRWDLVVINPSLVLGPALNPHSEFESKKFMLQMGNGDMKSGVPDIKLGIVDVRNVAEAHLNAGYNPKARGRYIISSESMGFLSIGNHLRQKFGNKYPIPKRVAPKFLVWLIAPIIGIKRNFVSRNVGYGVHFNNSKSKKELSIDYIPVKQTVIDFFQQFIDEKLI